MGVARIWMSQQDQKSVQAWEVSPVMRIMGVVLLLCAYNLVVGGQINTGEMYTKQYNCDEYNVESTDCRGLAI